MVSKPRLALGMLVLAVLAAGLLALLISLDVGAFWAKTLPLVLLAGGATFAHSLGLFTKAPKD